MMNNNNGFTLIEVLISMLIMTIGLLGLASLQMAGLKDNQSSYYRSQATQLAYDMADRIRSNMVDSNKGSASIYITKSPTAAVKKDACTTVNSTACTPIVMAENDLFQWNQELSTILPLGTGLIEVNGTVFSITINWDDNRDGTVDDDSSNNIPDDPNFKMNFQL